MLGTYLWRELRQRSRQTTIIAIGTAIAIALVMIVSAFSTGVKDAQAQVLEGVYGVGTDITVSATPVAPEEGAQGGPMFEFGADDGTATDDGGREIAQSVVTVARGQSTLDGSTLDTVLATEGVSGATASLSLQSTSFSGEIPDIADLEAGGPGQAPPTPGGADGDGGSAFSVESITALGIDPAQSELGALSTVTVVDGRLLDASDAGQLVAVLSETYAVSAEVSVGDSIELGGSDIEVVGIVAAGDGAADVAADVLLPLDTAQSLADAEGLITTIAVQATSADDVAAVQAALEDALPEATVSTQAELASSISGSLSTASTLVSSLGTWLSVLVLGAAFLISILFTTSGVGRRTREFGTLKAIGWSNGRVVGQVAGESLVQGIIGGAVGVALGLAGISVINALGITLSAESGVSTAFEGPGGFGGMPGAPGEQTEAVSTAAEVLVQAPVSLDVVLVAVALALLGGLLAAAFGGWRAARLRPAVALRTVS